MVTAWKLLVASLNTRLASMLLVGTATTWVLYLRKKNARPCPSLAICPELYLMTYSVGCPLK
jgi:hypothetical protein